MRKFAWALMSALVWFQATWAAEPAWMTDLAKAQEQAKTEHKLVLLDFTGSNWCPDCKALHKAIFTSREFAEFAKENLVLVVVDFPMPNRLPKEQQATNDALARKFDIEGYPTVVVLDSQGKQLTKYVGYEGESASTYVARLKKLKR